MRKSYNSKFREEDFDRMVHPIHRLSGFVWEKFKEFDQEPFRAKDPALHFLNDKYLRFVIYLLDKGCPLQKVNNLKERKHEAFLLSGLAENSEENQIVGFQCPPLQKILGAYLKKINDKEWVLLKADEQAYYTLIEKMFQPIDTTDIGSDKEKNAYAALRACATDARFFLTEMEEILKKISESQEIKQIIQKEITGQLADSPIEMILSRQK